MTGEAESLDLVVPAKRRSRCVGRALLHGPEVRPLADGSPSEPGSSGCFGIRVRFELEKLASRTNYVAAYLLLCFDDPRVAAVDLRLLTPEPGTETTVSVLREGTFGWLLGDPRGRSSIPLAGEAQAILRAPYDSDLFAGTMRMDASVLRPGLTGRTRLHARSAGVVEFDLRPPEGWPVVPDLPPPRPGTAKPRQAAVRLCVAADTEKYSRFRVPEAARAQQRFVEVLASARRHAGLADEDVDLQQSGDGEFAILPAGVDETVVLPKLVEGIRDALAKTNSDLSDRARLRLRVAFHRGHVAPGANGWLGPATIAVHRLLDSEALRTALGQAPESDLALIVPDLLYSDVIADHYGLLDPARFTPVDVEVPAKDFAERAWVYVPTKGAAPK